MSALAVTSVASTKRHAISNYGTYATTSLVNVFSAPPLAPSLDELPLCSESYLSGSRKTAATFASRGDGSGTTVWPRSIFGDTSPVAAAAKGDAAAPPVDSRHKKFRYRLVAKCRVLKGDGVKEVSFSHGTCVVPT